jgi:phosphoglycerol transferase
VTHPKGAISTAATAVLALLAAIVLLELWTADLRVPFADTGDATLNLIIIKDVVENPWYFEVSRLGAPHGLELYDFPVVSGETLNLLLFRILALGSGDPVLAMNLFFLLTFPLVALTALVALRRLGVSREAALVFALLYTLLPYHFLRGETHLFLAAYYAVPLGAYLALAVYRGDNLVYTRRARLFTAASCAVVATASGSGYYAVFTVVLVAIAMALRFIVHRRREALVAGGAVIAAITLISLVQLAPTIAYRVQHGTNEQVAKRYWFESENYSLRLTNLVLPLDDHRIGALARRKREYTQQIPQTEARSATLGIVATIGLLWLIGLAVAAVAGLRRRYDLGLQAGLAALTLAALLIATTGGFSTLIAVAWPQIRSWNRLSVFIAFFALAAVALGVDALRGRVRRPVGVGLLVAILAVGTFDQTTSTYVPSYDAIEADWRADAAFYDTLERRLRDGAMIVQLPYEPFPEPPTPFKGGYEPAKAYLHSDDLRWSYGAMRGRPEDWAGDHANEPMSELVRDARQAGFSGLLLDGAPYADHGAAIEAQLRGALRAEPMRSANGRFLFWRL